VFTVGQENTSPGFVAKLSVVKIYMKCFAAVLLTVKGIKKEEEEKKRRKNEMNQNESF